MILKNLDILGTMVIYLDFLGTMILNLDVLGTMIFQSLQEHHQQKICILKMLRYYHKYFIRISYNEYDGQKQNYVYI